jgi:histone-lysine N-methyltransferase SETMAR
MLTVIWGVSGFQVVDLMTSQDRFNSRYFVNHVMIPLTRTIFPGGRRAHIRQLNVQLSNCRAHFTKVAERFFTESDLLLVSHLPYSPDIVPLDFWLFGRMKSALPPSRFTELEALLKGINDFLGSIEVSELAAVFRGRVEQVRWVIEHNGDYYPS